MKDYIHVEPVRESDAMLNNKLCKANISAFHEGDIINITEKLKGVQVRVRYDQPSGKLVINCETDIKSIYPDYTASFPDAPFERYPDYEFFGECITDSKNENNAIWHLFSVYDHAAGKYMPQSFVKGFAVKYQFGYPHELYYGPFYGWDHVYKFCNNLKGKGIIIKNQSALEAGRHPHVLKYMG